ncbi:integrin-linked kinase-associated serine threonine phosphatase 2c isoform x1 [Plasmopara halstedii]|uniref:Integrin-linked kinase-associated serine threonine phosphatase 2c isoform x1 n=1 Tax=Plasmopara halstedii TaxID=4781 RepID=A0A0P1AAN7_PLAHL|nr:integrin-linked kinase-associated serine threonine phosphatase 2c isoform x1 [Plasmopara halstedii]CEG37646.1 integrin-linked kinase-associated serine threonine phosphatase 2c isoform x1 [Plasmopara halstedii]|eukprot:XP_024574015.1 integrin-linked kinase-associated serine threonine phosphatase 2c isoform x1 [Plasmopara halstedii]
MDAVCDRHLLPKSRAESGIAGIEHTAAGNEECDKFGDRTSYRRGHNEQTVTPYAGDKNNRIRLLDVASLCVEGSQGHTNEDRCVFASNDRFHLFAVMDGHGGSLAGDFLVEELLKTLDEVYDDGFDDVKLTDAMEELDRAFCAMASQKIDTSGACLLVVLLFVDSITNIPQKLILNIGDCRAIIHEQPEKVAKQDDTDDAQVYTKGNTFALSEDHCANNAKERMRALSSGADIQNKRIAGVLEPFRTIGDIDMKGQFMKNWVIATPEIHRSELLVGRSTFVIATDGVWAVLNNDCTMALALRKHDDDEMKWSAKSSAQAIIKKARELGSCDDITVIIVSV